MRKLRSQRDRGYSVMEMLVALMLFAILSQVAVSNMKELENPLANTAFTVTHYLRLVRARAISQTLYMRVIPTSTKQLAAYSSTSCTGATTLQSDLVLDLEDEISLTSTSWSVCFTQRGLADDPVTFVFSGDGGSKTVQIALGGGIKIQ